MIRFDINQQYAYDMAISGENVFVSGMGGVGKTYVIKAAIDYWRKNGKKVTVCAYTKQAALNLDSDSGVTVFNAFNTYPDGLRFDEAGLKRLRKSIAWNSDIIIVDEISMCSKSLFSYICTAIRQIGLQKDYKKIPLIVIGDFFQLPPVCGKGKPTEYAFESKWWAKMEFIYAPLETSHRQQDLEYFNHLCQIRKGIKIKENIEYIKKDSCYLQKKADAVTLCSYRDDVKKINLDVINKLPGEPKLYFVRTDSPKFMDDLGIWACLTLKIGTLVMTTYNDPQNRYHNGSTGIIIEMSSESVKIRFSDSTPKNPHIEEVGYHKWVNSSNDYVEQLPIIPAYSITIHKAQGCTLDYVNVNPKCFAEGQLYVALSRVRDVKHLYINSEIKESDIKVSPKVLRFYEQLHAMYTVSNRSKIA